MVKAIDVANLLLGIANENGDVITNLKLQKLLYYAQAWYLVNSRRRLYSDTIEAWEFGPVVREVYNKWKSFGSTPIPYKPTGNEKNKFTKSQLSFLNEFYRVFSSFSATALVSMAHNEDPWKNAFGRGRSSNISTREMYRFYMNLYKTKYGKKTK